MKSANWPDVPYRGKLPGLQCQEVTRYLRVLPPRGAFSFGLVSELPLRGAFTFGPVSELPPTGVFTFGPPVVGCSARLGATQSLALLHPLLLVVPVQLEAFVHLSFELCGFRSFRSIAGVGEVVFAFSGAEFGDQFSNSATKSWNSSFGGLAQKRLQFAERLLDRIEIGRVFWQVKQCCTGRCDEPLDRGSLVCRQIVDDDEVAAPEDGPQTLFEIRKEAGSVHRPVHHERRNHLVVTKPGDKGHRLPVPLRHAADQPLATPAAAPQPRHIGRS